MRISDWSSDVCSSDLFPPADRQRTRRTRTTGRNGGTPADRDHTRKLKRVAVLVAVDLAPTDMVGRTDKPVALHPLDPFGGGVVTYPHLALERSEERRVGKECVSTCRSRGSPYH